MLTNTIINVENVNAHLYDIEMNFEAKWENVILEMPSWTPGSYFIREYARHVQNFSVLDQEKNETSFEKVRKNQWQITCKKGDMLSVKYSVYAFELTVRTAYLDDRKGLIVPAAMFFYQLDPISYETDKSDRITIEINLPHGWKQFSSLRQENGKYYVEDFDEFVDTPIAIGVTEVVDTYEYDFDSLGKKIPNQVVIIGDKYDQDIEKFAKDLQKLQSESIRMFGDLPYDRYVWLLYIVDKGGGGLEHKFSNCSIISRYNFSDPDKYQVLMGLEAHEHFHVYNIKRIRPKQLGPFNYSSEVYTKLLWVAEGLTSFYDNVQLPRSKIITEEKYWEIIAKDLLTLSNTHGRLVQSIEDSSFDAWIGLYMPDENSSNSKVSYYLKGGLVGLMLDLEIRKQTNGENSLDTFYKGMYEKYKENPLEGFPESEIRNLMEELTKTDLEDFWNDYIQGTTELEIEDYLNLIGMEIKSTKSKNPYTGLTFESGSRVVSKVDYNSPAMKAGIFAKDKIIAVSSFSAKDNYDTIINNSEGKEVEIHLFRDGKLLQYTLIPGEPEIEKIEIKSKEEPSEEELKIRKQFFVSNE